MFLITTADQRFWRTDGPILFLGEWCKLFSQRTVWEKLSYEVLPYHWDDRKKLYQDYLYLGKLYEQTLIQMKDLLNRIHGVDHSLRYWRIVIGPWLFYFIQILYDRYLSIITAIEFGKVTGTLVGRYDEAKWLPRDFPCFLSWFVNDDYNHYIYSRIIEFTGKLPFEVIETKDEGNHSDDHTGNAKHPLATKTILRKLIEFYGKIVPDRFNQIVLITSYLNHLDLIRLQLSLKQIPYLLPPSVEAPESGIDLDTREKLSLNPAKSEFEELLGKMIKEQIPLIYVEGYAQMNKRSLKAYPGKASVIFTANAYFSIEAFKFWAAHHVDRGVKFVGTQHGGLHGTGLWFSIESHEIKIYDLFYTWGWKSSVYKNTKPLAAAKLNNAKGIRSKKDGRILLVLSAVPRYSYHMFSGSVASSGMLSYIDDQYRFVKALYKENQKQLLVRLYIHDYGWRQKERWLNEFPEVKCCFADKSMIDQLKECRLFIGTYNATSYLETFVANFPTILFWNPEHWELRSSAIPYFDELRNVGILHDTPKSAASMVNKISHDPVSWWKQPEIQAAKDEFCFQFAHTSNSWLKKWKSELLKVSKGL